jgi:hypothetical protein
MTRETRNEIRAIDRVSELLAALIKTCPGMLWATAVLPTARLTRSNAQLQIGYQKLVISRQTRR